MQKQKKNGRDGGGGREVRGGGGEVRGGGGREVRGGGRGGGGGEKRFVGEIPFRWREDICKVERVEKKPRKVQLCCKKLQPFFPKVAGRVGKGKQGGREGGGNLNCKSTFCHRFEKKTFVLATKMAKKNFANLAKHFFFLPPLQIRSISPSFFLYAPTLVVPWRPNTDCLGSLHKKKG